MVECRMMALAKNPEITPPLDPHKQHTHCNTMRSSKNFPFAPHCARFQRHRSRQILRAYEALGRPITIMEARQWCFGDGGALRQTRGSVAAGSHSEVPRPCRNRGEA